MIISIYKKTGLLTRIIIAIALGILLAYITPLWIVRFFETINSIFGNFLSFAIPLIILGLVAPGIAEIGSGAGRLLGITTLLAYGSTLFSGFFAYFTCKITYPMVLEPMGTLGSFNGGGIDVNPYFVIEMPPVMGVMTALLVAFIVGLGLTTVQSRAMKNILVDLRDVMIKLINNVIIPFLPLYIFGIFLKMGYQGQSKQIMSLFFKVIIIIFIMHVALLLIQYIIAGIVAKRNPLKMLKQMMPAYMTALGTQSSAATIPVTLERTIGNGVNPKLAGFVIPLCATIHLAGSIMKIVACSMAIMFMVNMPIGLDQYFGFILMLGITMVAAPGVPGGAIMAALGLLHSMLGFDEILQALMIALYIAMDSFGTACNVTGDGAIAVIVDKIHSKKVDKE